MPEIIKTDEPPPDAGHEDSDVNVNAIIKTGVILVLVVAFVQILLVFQWEDLNADLESKDRKLSPLAAKERPKLPENIDRIPAPRLQSGEVHDLNMLREKEDKLINDYQWVDAKKGIVRIPVERAIEILSSGNLSEDRGIRVRNDAKVNKSAGAP